ncbi:hypothetical protein SAMN06297422_11646 [Lachnospiraceae bacterium]|nr:hypothetical protein SAMN06297422_11646 [Lachnospiraceae bacterium]
MINLYIKDIRKSLENECYYSSLSLALMLPDICGMVEYPNKDVGERYIKWCDTFLCPFLYGDGNKGMSGETIYNLRNVYMHQGSFKLDSGKVKNKENRIDKFILVVGSSEKMYEFTISLSDKKGNNLHRAEMINANYLCLSICECVQQYYDANMEKFSFEYNVIPSEILFPPASRIRDNNSKILKTDDEIVEFIKTNPEIHNIIQNYVDNIDIDLSDNILEETKKKDVTKEPKKTKSKETKKNTAPKRENQIRSFFGQHFKKQFYRDNKETIIYAVLKSKTKQQVNNKLQKVFPNKEAGEIYQKLLPLIKDMPGR